jgi:signal transduction histidine kinase/ligand-binding sensor domain-containing protein/CheY-like chemotaxis protein/AraC-like DNA-binding protein
MKTLRDKYLTAIILLPFLFINQLHAFYAPPVTYLGIEQGLSNNAVRCIYQDHKGFMWFGTYDGLNRYDGYGFKVFRNKFSDSASLSNNWVYAISEDIHNNLWVGTRQGISVYNTLSGKFSPVYYLSLLNHVKQKVTVDVNTIQSDNQGNMLIGTEQLGLLFCSKADNVAVQVPFKEGGKVNVRYMVQSIKTGRDNRIWLFIKDKGLCIFDQHSMVVQLVNPSIQSANCLETDGLSLWVGTNNGLYRYSVVSNSYNLTFNEVAGRLTSDVVVNLCLDKTKHLWVATNGGGINLLDTQTGKLDYLLPGNDKFSLTSESVYAIYEDKDSRKWIGTLRGGINIIDPEKGRFQTIAHDPVNPNSLINNFAFSFYEGAGNNLWIGTDGGGLSIWNRTDNRFTNYKHIAADPSSLSNNFITGIRSDYQGTIWISTFGGGVNRYNPSGKSFTHYPCINPADHAENKIIWSLYEDKKKNFWANSLQTGFYLLNRTQSRFDLFDGRLKDVLCIAEDRDGELWGGNFSQLIQIDTKNKKHQYFNVGKPVRCIYEDQAGNFWVGTEGGLLLFDRKQHKIVKRYTTEEGLCNNAVLTILDDKKGNLWMSTFNGIAKFTKVTQIFHNYYQSDGLQSNQFNYNAATVLRSGEFVFGGIKGFNIFYPDNIHPVNNMPPLLFTGLRINNLPIEIDVSYVKEQNENQIEELEIPYNKAVVSFDFTALEYSSPNKIAYAYYLEGWDRGWNYTGNIRTATYTHLNEGNYVFRVKCTNTEGAWISKEITLKIRILPPWYRSWWAYLFYAGLIGAVIYFYSLYKARQKKLEFDVKIARLNIEEERKISKLTLENEREIARLTLEKEREIAQLHVEKEREINEKKLSFFTNISHEFRSPLTLIINPVKDMLQKNRASGREGGNELTVVYRNARRLLSLVDQLLLFRKADSGADSLQPAKLNFYEVCKEVYLCFVQQAQSRKITYLFACDNEALEIYADREKVEIILYNLISNALKYTPAGGEVSFVIRETEKEVTITVADSGCGITGEVGDKLFEKFYKAERKGAASKPGFGIGLFLVKQYTEAHKGQISYTSEIDKGTTFTLLLPKGKDHFDQDTIAEDAMTDVEQEPVLLDELTEDAASGEDNPAGTENNKNRLDALVSEKQTILVVDDEKEIRQYLAQVFCDQYTIYEAENGEAGRLLAQKYLPDIIISDIKMPGMDGIELCKNVKNDPALSHIPVILLTSSSSPESKLEGIEGGADDYITKPFDKGILMARVINLLKTRNSLQKYFYNEITLNNKSDSKISEEYKEFLDKCIAVVEAHLEDDDFTVKTLSSEIGMSHSNLYRKVKAISGQSLNTFIRFIRLRKAAELMINTPDNVNEIAFRVGINHAKYFREQFHKLFGMNPSDYIKKYRKPFSSKYNLNKDSFTPDKTL